MAGRFLRHPKQGSTMRTTRDISNIGESVYEAPHWTRVVINMGPGKFNTRNDIKYPGSVLILSEIGAREANQDSALNELAAYATGEKTLLHDLLEGVKINISHIESNKELQNQKILQRFSYILDSLYQFLIH